MAYPVLYSFRRCPYAMRARLALAYANIAYEHREIMLKDRPQELYDLSPKGTVPVLQLRDETVIDESIDIMKWALVQHDPEKWYTNQIDQQDSLIERNDGEFKKRLDKYKYHVRFPAGTFESHREEVGKMLVEYDTVLASQKYLLGAKVTLADMALFPFVRQCAHVDLSWFNDQFIHVSNWLHKFKASDLFLSIMKKHNLWKVGNTGMVIKGT